MALDMVEVMKHYGFDRFPVVGHDRGGRVGQRLALDHPDKVTHLTVLDIVPTYYLYTHVTIEFVQAYYHWFHQLRPAPVPGERALRRRTRPPRRARPIRFRSSGCGRRPTMENIHAMCEDYRAAASIDLQHDKADLDKKITCPLSTLWGERGPMGRLYDVLAIWKERGTKVTGKGLPGGHNLMIDTPQQVVDEVTGIAEDDIGSTGSTGSTRSTGPRGAKGRSSTRIGLAVRALLRATAWLARHATKISLFGSLRTSCSGRV